jgi:hypothetical protein
MNSSIVRTTRLVGENGLYMPTPVSGGGGGGITQLTGDVLAGPAVGTTPATVVRVNGATVPAAGALTTGAVLRVTGPSSLGYGQVNLALPAAVTGLLPVANIAPSGTNGFVLTTTGGATVWAAAASGGITQLTGDVTAGPGSGSVAATVIRVNGATVPAAGALTIGNGLYVTGASALGYSALNLAGGANFVTGLLPVANIAPSGTNGFVLTTVGGATVWAAAGGGGGITQLTQDVLAGPGAGSQAATIVQITGATGVANVINGTSLDFLKTGDPVATTGRINFQGTAAEIFLAYQPAGVNTKIISTDGVGSTIFGDSTNGGVFTVLIGGSGNNLTIEPNAAVLNSTRLSVVSTPSFFDANSNVTIGGTTADFGGAAGMLAFAPLTTAPTTAPATNGLLGQGPDGLHYGAPNATPAYLTDYMLAPDWQGANNTQASKKLEYAGEGRGVGAGSTTLLTIQVPLGNVITIRVLATARDVAGGTVGDGLSVDTIFQFQNVGGTVTQATTLATPLTASSASLVGVLSVTASVSGTNALVNGVATVAAAGLTIDWTAIATVIVD